MSDQEKEYKITEEGSLGLLALGDVGIEKWREVRAKSEAEREAQKDDSKNSTATTDGEETNK